MAQLKNTQFFTLDQAIWNEHGKGVGELVTVGNNRQIRLGHGPVSKRPVLTCYLHGHPVATFERVGDELEVFLNTCGYLTTTTRAAMADFMGAMGIRGNASIAGGELSAFWNYRPDHFTNCGHRREFDKMPTGQVISRIPLRQLD